MRSINLPSAVGYLMGVAADRLDGLYLAVDAAMKRNGVEANRKAARGLTANENATGSIANIMLWASELSLEEVKEKAGDAAAKEDAKALQSVRAVLDSRYKKAGREKPTE